MWYSRRLSRYTQLHALLDRLSQSASAAIDVADAIALYECVQRLKPRCLLELGPGTSTNVICLAIDEMQRGDPRYVPRFISVEEHPEWLRYHEAAFEPSLRKHVDFLVLSTATKSVDAGGPVAAHYVGLPELEYDFVFVDGPDHGRLDADWSCDVIELAPRLAARTCVVFDGRELTARRTWEKLRFEGFTSRRNPYSLCYELSRSGLARHAVIPSSVAV